MKFPLGKKGLVASAAIAGAVVYWRVRQTRRDQERQWQEELDAATDEGILAAQLALREEPGTPAGDV